MKKLLLVLFMLSGTVVVLPNCRDGQEDGSRQTEAKVEPDGEGAQFEQKVKTGGKFGVPHGVCKGFTQGALQFFQDQATGGEREVFATELKQRLDTAQSTFIVDVRPVSEYGAAHIPSSVNIPLDVLFTEGLCPSGSSHACGDDDHDDDDDDDDDDHDRNVASGTALAPPPTKCKPTVLPTDGTPIVLVSANGHAASMAAGLLGAMGYNVYALRFGIIAWAQATDVQIYRTDRTQRIQGLNGPLLQ